MAEIANPSPVYDEAAIEARRRERRNRKSTKDFWRAARYLYPYRGMVITSIVCALFIGIAFTGGLSSMVPMMQVFLKNDTIGTWAQRKIAERRLGVELTTESGDLRILKVTEKGAASRAGLKAGDLIGPREALASLSDPGAVTVSAAAPAASPMNLAPLPRYLAAGREIAIRM